MSPSAGGALTLFTQLFGLIIDNKETAVVLYNVNDLINNKVSILLIYAMLYISE